MCVAQNSVHLCFSFFRLRVAPLSPSPQMRRAAATLLARALAPEARGLASSARAAAPTHVGDELFCRQRSQITLGDRVPTLSPDAWVAPNAVLVGDVDLYDQVSVECGGMRGKNNAELATQFLVHAARARPPPSRVATR